MKNAEERYQKAGVRELIELYQWSVDHLNRGYNGRVRSNLNTRYARWPNQSEDERRWKSGTKDGRIYPWEGASDLRCRLVDKYLREDVAFLMVLWNRMRTVVTPVEIGDSEKATRLTQVLRWMKYTRMNEMRREARLLANYLLERGAAVMGVFWERREELAYRELGMEDLEQWAQLGLVTGNLPTMVMDPGAEEALVKLGQSWFESNGISLTAAEVRDLVKSLRETGSAQYAAPEVIEDQPRVVAFALGEDLILPPDFSDWETAHAVFWREKLTETTLRSRVRTNGWNERWVEAMIERGRGAWASEDLDREVPIQFERRLVDWDQKLYRVIHVWRRMYDPRGVPGIWYTCFAPMMPEDPVSGAKDFVAAHELLPYAHGKYPFVLFEREVLSRNPHDSRGYGEVGSGMQRQLKVQWDTRVDRTMLATMPPRYAPPGRSLPMLGPGVEFETNRPEAYGFLEAPRYDVGSKEVELTIRQFADEYFGRSVEGRDPTWAQLQQQELANVWFEGWREVDTMILQLMQQYMPDEFYYRVVGSQNSQPLRTGRQEIQGQFDVSITYDVTNFNRELASEKLGLITQMLQMDTAGLIDRGELLQMVADLIEPNAAERLVRSKQAAALSEIEDERAVFAQLLSGVQVDVKPGQNYGLRHQVLTALLQQNPTALQRLRQDPHLQEVVMNRLKQLEQQMAQEQNRLIGVYGALPTQQGPNVPELAMQAGGKS